MAPLLPENLVGAEVLSVQRQGEDHVILIRYDGASASATVESVWRDDRGRPKIVDAKFV